MSAIGSTPTCTLGLRLRHPPTPPPPPPGTWVVTGSGCEEVGDCVQSKNHPGN